MTRTITPARVAAATAMAIQRLPEPAGLFFESSRSMFDGPRALCELDLVAPYCRFSTHWGSMGSAFGGMLGFCMATGRRAVCVGGDATFHLHNPFPAAVKHGARIAIVLVNDGRLGLPFWGCERVGAQAAQATTTLPAWDFAKQGSSEIACRRVEHDVDLAAAIDEALAYDGCALVDVLVDPEARPDLGGRAATVDSLFSSAPAATRRAH